MIIWGWGKVTRRKVAAAFQRTCGHCNRTEIWNLCIVRTWFTLFFIPLIPYKKRYCVECPNCGSYIELTQVQFEEMRLQLLSDDNNRRTSAEDSIKYQGKTDVQKSYLKQMEECKK